MGRPSSVPLDALSFWSALLLYETVCASVDKSFYLDRRLAASEAVPCRINKHASVVMLLTVLSSTLPRAMLSADGMYLLSAFHRHRGG